MTATALLTVACGLIAGGFHHQLGVAPILGAVLCAACFLRPRELVVVGLGGILVRDAFLGLSSFTLFRLAGMGAVIGMILALKIRPTFKSLLTGLLLSSPIFHLALAVGDWATGTCAILPKTPQGLMQSIAGAVPYFQRSFIGDILFTSLFLSAYVLFAYAMLGMKGKAFSWSE